MRSTSFFLGVSFLGIAAANFDDTSVLQKDIKRHGQPAEVNGRSRHRTVDGKPIPLKKFSGVEVPDIELDKVGQPQGGQRFVMRMHNNEDLDYTAVIHVSGQPIRCIMDTGSFELVIFSNYCKSSSCQNGAHFYQPNSSHTYEDLTWQKQLSYGSGDTQVQYTRELIDFGTGNHSMAFWMATDAQLPILNEGTFECIFGMSDPHEPLSELKDFMNMDVDQLSNCDKDDDPADCRERWRTQLQNDKEMFQDMTHEMPPLEAAGVQRFSMCFQKDFAAPGWLMWNDYAPDPHHFTRIEVTGHLHWSSNISNIRFGDMADAMCTDDNECSCLLDSGTSLLTMPSFMLESLRAEIRINEKSCENMDKYPNIAFNFHGQHIELTPEAYIGYVEGYVPKRLKRYFPHMIEEDPSAEQMAQQGNRTDRRCQLLVMTMDMQSYYGSSLLIMGMPFFRQFYTTFDFTSDSVYRTRAMHLAHAPDGCEHPTEAPQEMLRSSRSKVARTVDISKVKVASWLRDAEKRGKLQL